MNLATIDPFLRQAAQHDQFVVMKGDHRWRTVLDAHDRVVRNELSRYRGQEINTSGDGSATMGPKGLAERTFGPIGVRYGIGTMGP